MTTQLVDDQYNSHQNEVRIVANVSIDGTSIMLDRALEYDHYGGPEYAAEVALLSRYIVIEGNAASEVVRLGGHILCDRGTSAQNARAGKVVNDPKIEMKRYHLHKLYLF
jgi:hypothetical protein